MNKILLVGCGHMGSALLKAWSYKTNDRFSVVDPINYKKINDKYKGKVRAVKLLSEVKNILLHEIIIFAIKPQITNEVISSFKNYKYKKNTLFISIVAGKKISSFKMFLPEKYQLIRVMPNMPAIINQGMSCLVANENVSKKNKIVASSLFLKVGKTIWLKNEQDINKVTAISGSGPGYIFLFVDAFEKAAINLGLGDKITKELVHQTLIGSANLLLSENKDADELAKNIAVKGGTTEAGLNQFKKDKNLHKVFAKVISAAYLRSKKLGK